VELRLTEPDGTVLKVVEADNLITDVAVRRSLWYMLTGQPGMASLIGAGHGTVTQSNVKVSTGVGTMGFYAMGTEVDVTPETFLPPYVDRTLTGLSPDVLFYSTGGATEVSNQMVRDRAYLNLDTAEYCFDFMKTAGAYTIKSLCVGRSHAERASTIGHVVQPVVRNASLFPVNLLAPYLLEYGQVGESDEPEDVYLWKYLSGSLYRFQLTGNRSEELTTISNAVCPVPNLAGAVVTQRKAVNANYFLGCQVYNMTTSGTTVTSTIQYIASSTFRTTSGVSSFTIPFSRMPDVAANIMPGGNLCAVMVYRPDTDVFEVFQTVSFGDHGDAGFGFNVQKAVISGLDDIATRTVTIVDLGVLPYAIGNYNGNTYSYVVPGFYDAVDEQYYLPYYHVLSPSNTQVTVGDSAFTPGIIYDKDFTAVKGNTVMRTSTSYMYPFARLDGKVRQIWPGDSGALGSSATPYFESTQLFSALNLPEPLVKPADKVLHIIYKYKLVGELISDEGDSDGGLE
jgi:hypothetical protein